MANIEVPKGSPEGVKKALENFAELMKWGIDLGADDAILQAAAVLEPHELEDLKVAFDRLRIGLLIQEQKDRTTNAGCVLAALEIVKKNRANSPQTTVPAPEVTEVQEGVRGSLDQ